MRRALLIAAVVATSAVADAQAESKARRAQAATIVFLVDRSPSMHGPRLAAAKLAVLGSLKLLEPRDRFSIVFFDCRVSIVFEDRARSDRSEIEDLAKNVNGSPDLGSCGSNPLAGIEKASAILRASNAERKFVVVLTDGEVATDGIADAVRGLSETGVVVSGIGTAVADPDARSVLALIGDKSKGRLHLVDDLAVLPTVVARELRGMLVPARKRQ